MSSPSDLVVHTIKQDCIEGVAAMDGGSGKSWSSLINESFVIFPAPLSDCCPVAASPSLVDRTSPMSLYFEAAIEVAIPTRSALSDVSAATTDDVREAALRKTALHQITDKAREFGAGPLFDKILPLLMESTCVIQARRPRLAIHQLASARASESSHNAPVKPKQIFANPGPYQMARKRSQSGKDRRAVVKHRAPYDEPKDASNHGTRIKVSKETKLSLYPRPGYTIELEWECSQCHWAAGAPVNPNWKSIILEEQQNIMNSIKQSAESSAPRNPGESPTEEWPPGRQTAPVNEAPHVEVPAQPPPPQPPQHQEECEKSSVPPPTCSAHHPSDSRSMLSHDQDGHASPSTHHPHGPTHEHPPLPDPWISHDIIEEPDELSQSQPSCSKLPVDKPPVTPDRWEGSLGHSSGSIRSVASDRSIGQSPPKPEDLQAIAQLGHHQRPCIPYVQQSFQALTLPGYQKLEEEMQRKEKEIWEQEAALFMREEEVKRREVEVKRKEDDVRRKEQQAKKLEQEEKRHAEEAQIKVENTKREAARQEEVKIKADRARLEQETKCQQQEAECRRQEDELYNLDPQLVEEQTRIWNQVKGEEEFPK
ncbi:hypothetical protein CPB84DRAFT_1754445 [Gymnopilus junonius]|uniref:Uncharacterized protein n=1 Tax=Gymnopilus junonius TaxID=109634 RepID=A0A9P5N6W5_GYMJU|nr:hypothetical protein CPB84DRAFT_1754445 [Gymnopilus junonius]